LIYFLTFLWALPSGLIWLVNAEAMVVFQMTREPDAAPWLIALATVSGQFIGYAALYHFASKVLTRFESVRNAASKVQIKQPGWGSWAMFTTGGLMGVPPLLALFALYGSKRVGPLPMLMACAMPTRFVWYCGWAYAADFMRDNFTFF
jgi:hypothetical protein